MGLSQRSVLLVLLENGILTLSGVFLTVVFARTLGHAGLGEWKLVMSAQTFSMYILSFGFSMLVTRYTAEFVQRNRITAISQLLKQTSIISMIAAIFASTLYVSASYFGNWTQISSIFTPQNAILISLALSLNLLNDIIGRAFLTGLGRRDWVAIIQIVARLLFLSGIVTALTLDKISLRFAVLMLTAGYFSELVLYLFTIIRWKRTLGNERGEELTQKDKNRLIEFGGFQWLFRIFQSLREYAVDNFMLLAMKGVELVGLYGAAVAAPAILRGISPAKLLSGIILPRLVPRDLETSSNTVERIQFYFRLMQKITAITIWPLITILFILSEEFILLLFGDGFEEAATPMRILLLFMVPTMAADAFYTPALALDQSKLTFHVSLWGVVNVLLNLALIPHWGASGAAIGTGSIVLGIYLHYYLSLKQHGYPIHFPWDDCCKIGIAMTPLIAPVLIAKTIFSANLPIIISLQVGLVGYLFSIRNIAPFDLNEKTFLKREFNGFSRIFIKNGNSYV